MNEHAGASCALSVLIVGIFAVLLHDKDRTPVRPQPTAPTVARDSPRPPAPEPKPAPAPAAPRLETVMIAPGPPISVRPIPPTPQLPTRSPAAKVERPARPVVRKLPDRPRPAQPRGGFVVVEPGESLSDVAARVYGSAELADSLWKANRDQLAGLDAPLVRGTLLRTP